MKRLGTLKKNSRLAYLSLIVSVGAMLSLPMAFAHRVGIPVTTLEWHAPGKVWHLVHRLSTHDFTPAIEGLDIGGVGNPESQRLIGRYVIEHFSMIGRTDVIEVSYLGAEEEADSFYVYFQISTPDQSIEIRNDLFLAGESDERRHALVNVTDGKKTSTLLFTADTDLRVLDLARPQAP